MTDKNQQWKAFEAGMTKVLKADPQAVKAAMEQEKEARAEERSAKRSSSSSHAASNHDA